MNFFLFFGENMRVFQFLARMRFKPDPRFVGSARKGEMKLGDGNRSDVTPGPAWSRYLNAVSGRFIVDANRPTDRPTPVGTTKSCETGGDRRRGPREFIRRLTRLKLWHLN